MTTGIIASIERNEGVFREMLTGISDLEIHWREDEEKWNLLEIVCHLYDEEREDFRSRLSSVLEDPQRPFEPIDPAGAVKERNYAEKNFVIMLEKFLTERQQSVKWLRSLKSAAWENTYEHPQVGPMSARFILVNWLAHDYLHIRQITRVKYNFLKFNSGQQLHYAGDW